MLKLQVIVQVPAIISSGILEYKLYSQRYIQSDRSKPAVYSGCAERTENSNVIYRPRVILLTVVTEKVTQRTLNIL
jgi:hypothetical protein